MKIILQQNQIQLLFMIGIMSIVLFFVILCRHWINSKKKISNKKQNNKNNKNNKK